MNRTLRERIGLVSFFAVLLTFLGLAALLLAPFSGPLLCALSAAIILWPAHCWVSRQLPSPSRTLRASVSATAALFLMVAPLVVLTLSASNEAATLWPSVKENLRVLKNHVGDSSTMPPTWAAHVPMGLAPRLEEILSQSQEKIIAVGNRVASKAAEVVAGFAFDMLVLLANILLFEFVLFFLLRDGDRLFKQWNDLVPFPAELKNRLHSRAGSVIQGVFRGLVVVGVTQTAILAVAYLIIGVRAGVLLTSLTAVGTLIPGIGAGLVWIPLMAFYFMKGIIWKAVLLAVFGVFAGVSDNILRPMVAGPAMNLSLLWFLLSLLGGVQFFGALGILLGPMIFAILPVLLDAYRVYLDPP